MKIFRHIVPVLVVVGVILVISARTSGFKAFTTYSYELSQAQPYGMTFPDSLLIRVKDKGTLTFKQQTQGHYTLLSLVFLKCPTVCPIITARLHGLYRELAKESAGRPEPILNQVQFMTLSFDGARDKLSDLSRYKSAVLNSDSTSPQDYHEAVKNQKNSDRIWQFSVVASKNPTFVERQLKSVGFWIYVPYPGMYNHSPYLYLVGPDGRIKNVYDPGKMTDEKLIEQMLRDVRNS